MSRHLNRAACRDSYDEQCLRSAAPPWHAPPDHPGYARLRCCALFWMHHSGSDDNSFNWQQRTKELERFDPNWRLARLSVPLINDPLLVNDMLFARMADGTMQWDQNLRSTPRWPAAIRPLPAAGASARSVRTLVVSVYQQHLLAPMLRRVRQALVAEPRASLAGLGVTVAARDDISQPDAEARRVWCDLTSTVASAGVSFRLLVQNPAVETGALARPAPLGILETESLAAFLSTAAGRAQASSIAERHVLLLCCCMKTDGSRRSQRVRILNILQRNGFACDKKALPAGFGSSSNRSMAAMTEGVAPLRGYNDSAKAASLWQYYAALTHSKFVLAPHGQGRDSFRTWEALACGAVPVMVRDEHHGVDAPKYAGLPVLWLNSWHEVTTARLEEQWRVMTSEQASYDMRRMLSPWWIAEVLQLDRKRRGASASVAVRNHEPNLAATAADSAPATAEACARLRADLPAKREAIGAEAWRRDAVPGHCGITNGPTDCNAADKGSIQLPNSAWPTPNAFGIVHLRNTSDKVKAWHTAVDACLAKCAACARCRYVTVSIQHRDCSWYSRCSKDRLQATPEFLSGTACAGAPPLLLPIATRGKIPLRKARSPQALPTAARGEK